MRNGIYNHGGGPSEFIQAINLAHLLEMLSMGGEFTWSNNSLDTEFKQTRLDRTFINQHWIDTWSETKLKFFSGTSDDAVEDSIINAFIKYYKASTSGPGSSQFTFFIRN